ncbi:2-keto-4-pentenoate hydratase [Noviherbaspirillum saxi]|uniref:2-keto-4-pentenoate hydratase n=1 Tax=Noviherbaspirillum saxi TaxID=2320863 RepID=A0A3A3FPZ0_9BURK|nr:fumarylacetoacetate hydrolase family protein [Noviherbaspirillum saxi]RJF95769.1 2-keto-4-pentenoate hydratase [Noviherbaspirillum saxi]
MSVNRHANAAEALRAAAESGQYIKPLTEQYPDLALEDAYAIQRINTEYCLAAGRRRVGCKIGLTSPAVQRQLGVDQPDFGILFDDMGFDEGLPIPFSKLHQPKIEAEVAFVLGRDLDMEEPGLVDVMRAIEFALPALEIVGSRILDWKIRLVDTVADNASSSGYVLGSSPRTLAQLDLRNCTMALQRNGEIASSGNGSACMGNPLNAVVWLARTMARMGAPLKAGELVLSGALGPMLEVRLGDAFVAEIQGLGSVSALFDTVPEAR